MTDTHRLRAFAVHLAGDGYTDEHVRMIEDAADEIERLRTELAPLRAHVRFSEAIVTRRATVAKAEG